MHLPLSPTYGSTSELPLIGIAYYQNYQLSEGPPTKTLTLTLALALKRTLVVPS